MCVTIEWRRVLTTGSLEMFRKLFIFRIKRKITLITTTKITPTHRHHALPQPNNVSNRQFPISTSFSAKTTFERFPTVWQYFIRGSTYPTTDHPREFKFNALLLLVDPNRMHARTTTIT